MRILHGLNSIDITFTIPYVHNEALRRYDNNNIEKFMATKMGNKYATGSKF